MWYDADEDSRLFQATLAKTKDYLTSIDFRGDVDINCIIHENNVWPLEFTARFGNPATALQIELHDSPWHEFLGAVADGERYELKFKKGYGVVVTVAVPPFPYYIHVEAAETSKGLPIAFRSPITPKDWKHYGFEELAMDETGRLYIAGSRGCVAHVSGFGETVQSAQRIAYERVHNMIVPKMFYRADIGTQFIDHDQDLLKQWGWL
jgi:phosphoribosylamine--glycine ligase